MRKPPKNWRSRVWGRLAGNVESIRESEPWGRGRHAQARLLRYEWSQSPGWSFTIWTGFAPIVPMAVAAFATTRYGVGVAIASAVGGYVIGVLALWLGSWVFFAIRSPSRALIAARAQIAQLDGRIDALAIERDQAIAEREALEKRPELEIEELVDSTINPAHLRNLKLKITRATNCNFKTDAPQPGGDEVSPA